MAIINRPGTEIKVDPPEEVSGIISRPRTTGQEHGIVDDRDVTTTPNQGTGFPAWLKWGLLLLLIVGIIAVAALLLPGISAVNKAAPDNIALDVDRLIRIDSVIALLEQRIEHNQETLQSSEKNGDTILIDTMRLALATNFVDLEKHQDSYIQVLESLQRTYSANPDSVITTLREHLKSSTDSYKLGRVSAINEAITLISSVPENKSPTEYFIEKVKTQK